GAQERFSRSGAAADFAHRDERRGDRQGRARKSQGLDRRAVGRARPADVGRSAGEGQRAGRSRGRLRARLGAGRHARRKPARAGRGARGRVRDRQTERRARPRDRDGREILRRSPDAKAGRARADVRRGRARDSGSHRAGPRQGERRRDVPIAPKAVPGEDRRRRARQRARRSARAGCTRRGEVMVAAATLPVLQARARKNPREWRWQLRNAVSTVDDLSRAISLTPRELEGARRAERAGLPIAITSYYLSLADREDPADPIRLQCVPDARESEDAPGDLVDPLGEEAHTVAPHLVRRYPDRALLLVSDRCAVYCRFCTRSRMVGQGGGAISIDAMKPAFDWLRKNPEVRDVIVSGGDPLAMSTDKLVRVVAALREVRSVETIRLATRVPVTLPMRITRELVRALAPHHPIWVMTHFNHPREITPASRRACA